MRRALSLGFGAATIALGLLVDLVACGSSEESNGAPANDAGSSETGSSSGTTSTSSGGSSSGSTGTPCDAYARGLCTWLYRCVPNDVRLAFADVTTCTQRALIDCERTATAEGGAPMTTACGAELETYSCAAPIDFRVPPVVRTPACDLRGTLDGGRFCERDRQCAGGACIDDFVTSTGDIACGKCREVVSENGACKDDECNVGLQCVGSVCKKPPGKDEACASRQCAKPLRCVGAKCVDPLPANAPCNPPVGAEDPCDATLGLACTGGTCQSSVTPTTSTKADGQPCTETKECFWPAACVMGTCKVPPPKCK